MNQKKIVWLAPPQMTGGLKGLMEKYFRIADMPIMQIHVVHATAGMWKKRTKTIWEADESRTGEFFLNVARHRPDVILINDKCALHYLTGRRYKSLNLCRGSVYEVPFGDKIVPCIVLDDVMMVNKQNHAGWALINDLRKAKRWIDGRQKREPAFNHRVCQTADDLREFEDAATGSVLLSMDVETSGTGPRSIITCSGYTTWERDGSLRSWVIPFAAPYLPQQRFWQDAALEAEAHRTMRRVHDSDVFKVLQNGVYDCHYYVRYRCPPRRFLFDTAVAWHAIWPEPPKRIDYICSHALDYYKYWKDVHKEADKTDAKGKEIKVPQDEEGIKMYWMYCALDTHFTALAGQWLWVVLSQPGMEWARHNYLEKMAQSLGPAGAMSMRGVKVNARIQHDMAQRNQRNSDKALHDLRMMAGEPLFNPNSPVQVATLIYDVWQGQPLKRGKYKGKSASEIPLKLVQTQGPLLDRIIQTIWDTKKPANNVSKYGPPFTKWNDRWYYTQNCIGTETGRYSSSQGNWWTGTQIQNPPYDIRNMVDADEGYWLFNADYSQSDNWFTAFTSGEPSMMAAMLDDKDTHCMHASQFFQRPYEEIYKGYLADDPEITHSTRGIRQNTKRVVYGANYLMAAFTLFLTMGKEAVVASAKALGHADADQWGLQRLLQLCEHFIEVYFGQMYPGLMPWMQADRVKVSQNGNKATCGFGRTRTFFGNVLSDEATQRELASFYGQGGTAGNIDLALKRIYWQSAFEQEGGMLLLQMHDSITGQIPVGRWDLLDLVVECMLNECEIEGRRFTVPVDVDVGLGWGKRMVKYKRGVTTAQDIEAANQKWMTKWEQAA